MNKAVSSLASFRSSLTRLEDTSTFTISVFPFRAAKNYSKLNSVHSRFCKLAKFFKFVHKIAP